MEILDTPMDPYIELLIRVTRDIFKVDTVLVSLIDRDRQWFKARAGAVISCTARSLSFCGLQRKNRGLEIIFHLTVFHLELATLQVSVANKSVFVASDDFLSGQ